MFSWLAPRTTPLIIAHRGSSHRAPENTLAAFSAAIDDGADGIELDVRLTVDGNVVVFHDSRLERTTDGKGRIERCTSDQLKSMSAGAWFHPLFRAEKIPTLDAVLDLIDKRVGVNIELKSDVRSRSSFALVDEVLKIVQRHRAVQYVLLSSFHHPFLRYARSLRPGLARGYLFHTLTAFGRAPVRRTHRESGVYLIVNGSSCSKRLVGRAHDAGIRVGEYTVNSFRRAHRGANYRVDAIYTDNPGRIRQALIAIQQKSPR